MDELDAVLVAPVESTTAIKFITELSRIKLQFWAPVPSVSVTLNEKVYVVADDDTFGEIKATVGAVVSTLIVIVLAVLLLPPVSLTVALK